MLPKVCFGCNAQLYRGEKTLCTVCRNQLPFTEYNFKDENRIDRLFYGRVDVQKASSFLFFTQKGIVKNLIHQLKYKGQEQIGEFVGNWYGQLLKDNSELTHIDVVIPVPLHKKKLKKRGYNQVTSFGKSIAHHLNIPYEEHALIKTANTKTQTKKGRFFRLKNSLGLYEPSNTQLLKNKNVLLVDDVITTGATMEACTTALLKISGIKVYITSIAIVP